eukprot:CAMPEP_0197054950 /NCGR_PEP_ID=MMETSP1384-20130603/53343_1 /TAXON_ID=29189 /ORGANISM="Ammonia sp." /LENGTH=121 /DNA_ID=CAMNT_0042488323 /DNA_START=81 /DNA_END=446 /DNA_ORIENTATION=+
MGNYPIGKIENNSDYGLTIYSRATKTRKFVAKKSSIGYWPSEKVNLHQCSNQQDVNLKAVEFTWDNRSTYLWINGDHIYLNDCGASFRKARVFDTRSRLKGTHTKVIKVWNTGLDIDDIRI